ncbi:MAG: CHRD domain-containing protein [Anaerolineae bacterium]|nr:CHRD domain-containing protein [Anaerolineae bacterium]
MRRILLMALLAAIVFSLPLTVLANKQIFLASLTTGAEVHEVIGSNASGNGVLGTTPHGVRFEIAVFGLSGDATAAHIHGPAAPGVNGPVVVTLCGGPPPSVLAQCTMENGMLKITGMITNQLVGMNQAQFMSALSSGNLYINVHTQLNPAGEVRGQLYPR